MWCGYFKLLQFKEITVLHKDSNGRLLVVECKYEKTTIRIINVYASNREIERKQYYKTLRKWCTDFNTVQTDMDISINNVIRTDVSRKELYLLMKDYNLTDVWRASCPNTKDFSRRQVLSPILHKVFLTMAEKGTVPDKFTDGIINIFYKKKGGKT
uniref:Uncharacterized protein n=1 Tax=Sander lucioperca TaxID=283035 RepID=A0A8C9ZPN7_SANLU